jgi:hypothetical protein
MQTVRHPVMTFLVVAVLTLSVVVGAQTLADASAPPVAQMSQSKVVGQAGFAYLGGIRIFLAGTLYSRLDPQFHQYGSGSYKDRLDLLPAIRLIQMLNPQMEMPYYYASFVLYLRGRMPDALVLAKEGIANNPQSGYLRANYVQLLMMQDKQKNLPLMLQQTKMALGESTQYSSVDDEFEAYGIFRTVYDLAGDKAMAKSVNNAQRRLEQTGQVTGSSSGGGLLDPWQNSMNSPED